MERRRETASYRVKQRREANRERDKGCIREVADSRLETRSYGRQGWLKMAIGPECKGQREEEGKI